MQHVDELTGESMYAYFQWREIDENSIFQGKETQGHETLPAVHSVQTHRSDRDDGAIVEGPCFLVA